MSAETDDSAETCGECGLTLTDGECLTDGCPGPATETDDTSASSLMGGSSDGDDEEQESVSPGEVYDPAEDTDAYRESMLASAAENVPSTLVEDDDDEPWHELDEAERKARMRQTEIDTSADDDAVQTNDPDAVSEPAALDWHAFTRRYGFHYAGQGAQSRFVSTFKIEEATRLDDEIAGGGETFVAAAIEHPDVPLDMDQSSGRLLFRKEVLAR